jgi:hypothetical protein
VADKSAQMKVLLAKRGVVRAELKTAPSQKGVLTFSDSSGSAHFKDRGIYRGESALFVGKLSPVLLATPIWVLSTRALSFVNGRSRVGDFQDLHP